MRISDWSSDVCSSDLDADRRALRTGNEGLAAVDDPVVAIAAAAGLHHGGVRAGAAFVGGLAHEKGRARASRDERFEEMSLLLLAPHLREQIHIALVGRHRVDRDRTQRREARFLEDGRRIALAELASIISE